MTNTCTGYISLDNSIRTIIIWMDLINDIQCTMYNVQCTMYNAQCTMYKTNLVLKQIASTQTDFLPKHKLLLCGYAVLKLYRTVCYIINCAKDWNGIIHFTCDLQNILYWSVVFHVPRIVCVNS
jgi:hypothetical protein